MEPALMVVDVQRGFDDAAYWGPRNNPACEDNVAALIAHARERNWPLIYVRHDSTEERSPLRPDSPGNGFKDVVSGEPDVLISKHTNSCFYGEPDLHGWLQERGISQLVLCGITTNHCCETTARMAGHLGYAVRFLLAAAPPGMGVKPRSGLRFVLDATHSFDRGALPAEQLWPTTAVNLDGEFATV